MSEIIQMREDTWRIEDNGVRFFVLTGLYAVYQDRIVQSIKE